MLQWHILLRRLAPLAAVGIVAACGQKGALYIPATPAAQQRATLPQTLLKPGGRPAPPAPSASAPVVPVESVVLPQPEVPIDPPQ